jgi:hypothetical protein
VTNPDAASKLRMCWWILPILVRTALSSWAPALFTPTAFLLALRPGKRARTEGIDTFYADAVKVSERGARNMWLLGAVAVVAVSMLVHFW